ncbi:SDR family NAD(P)-dependent oxidoreductase [Arthrobacter sp. ISL-28]|uniref:SDR family NAD(P)-dependent oxidoreductase n=1 Tax=Arthrobacter sp. ISL-28 TaxID=2819108 RepID=UPI001BE60401|nr:SDR family oxidoreductase [Arthrobacter sp. ISL-28]MBT2520412.1 SDR family oxidoreductase [Arthrobacter sp. ISL-28]
MTSEPIALVTGGARGIGRSIAEYLAGNGWKVVATYNTGLNEATELKHTHGVEIRQLDLTDRSRSLDFARHIRDEYSFEALVNNAGILEKQSFEEFNSGILTEPYEAASLTPLGRNGSPDDMAKVVAFLLSTDASFVTGASIVADGGYTGVDYFMKKENGALAEPLELHTVDGAAA